MIRNLQEGPNTVEVQETAFSLDILGRYVCNTYDEAVNNGGFPFDAIVIGALTTHAEVASSSVVKQSIPALAAVAEGIGDRQVRNRGTLGGSIANNDPAADYPAAVLGLGATVHTNKRKITADDFFKGMYETALAAEAICASSFWMPGAFLSRNMSRI